MAAKQPSGNGSKLSPELLNAIAAERLGCFVDRATLSGKDVTALKNILKGRSVPDIAVDRKRALIALAEADSSEETAELLAGIAGDNREETRTRAAAARNLARMPQDAAEKALGTLLSAKNPTVQLASAKALLRIGSKAGLKALQRLPTPQSEALRKQLSLVRAVIALRTNEKDEGVQLLLDARWETFEARKIDPAVIKDKISAVAGPTFGIALNPNTAFEITCGGQPHILFLDEQIRDGRFTRGITGKDNLAGLIALEETETRHLTVRYLVLIATTEARHQLIVTQTNGEIAFAGEFQKDGEDFRIAGRDVRLGSAATEVFGAVSNSEINLGLRIWRSARRRKNTAKPIEL